MNADALKIMGAFSKKVFKEKTKNILDFEITLVNLSAKEDAEVFEMISDMKGTEFFHVLKLQTLARSIIAVNGTRFEKTDNNKEVLESKIEILLSWPSTIIDELYQVYSDLINEIDVELGFPKKEDENLELSTAQNIHAMNVLTENTEADA
jgi:hypothetical protein